MAVLFAINVEIDLNPLFNYLRTVYSFKPKIEQALLNSENSSMTN